MGFQNIVKMNISKQSYFILVLFILINSFYLPSSYAQLAIDTMSRYDVNILPDIYGNYGVYIGTKDTSCAIRYYQDSLDNSYISMKAFNDTSKQGFFLNSYGDIVIGTEDPCERMGQGKVHIKGEQSQVALYIDGTAFKTDGGALWETLSDSTLKTNVRALGDDCLDELLKVKLYEYTYSKTQKDAYGIMAQEMQSILPGSVQFKEYDDKEVLTFDASDLFYLHIKATQELAAKNKILEAENKTLEEEVNTMKTQLNELQKQIGLISESLQKVTPNNNGSAKIAPSTTENPTHISSEEPNTEQQAIQASPTSPSTTMGQEALTDTPIAKLYPCQPNPFTEETQISYYLPEYMTSASLSIVNINGQEVSRFALSGGGKGSVSFRPKALKLGSGTYFYQLIVDGKVMASEQMVVME